MSEPTQYCTQCRKDQPVSGFMRDDGEGPFKRCNRCRKRNTDSHRSWRASQMSNVAPESPSRRPGGHIKQPVSNNSTTAVVAASTSKLPAGSTLAGSSLTEPNTCHGNDTRSITIAPEVITTIGDITTSTTVVTITTTIRHGEGKVEMKPQDEPSPKVESDDVTSASSESSHDANDFPHEDNTHGLGFFVCIHCEKCQPAPLRGFSVCLLCITDWKWCDKEKHNRPVADFMWDGKEHDECIHCVLDIGRF
ncbi:hypothetical protein N7522_010775 [Penicillium canescens]|uniref:Uncharacterized protein n=1 Tax=Penicillium canescens TaxID=5083 RepID=A0AAD6IJJ1_PENCN|nr:uncharacterized protein N7446_006372 [Penicillium canescens]KAJ5990568.1 hypothetical protein N7522_010775 [Penicillium canescens]KAJ6051737.1 hypothetical protein N7460_002271 [Penicillium canescens]KAJ6062252.1 hypothetical protein N7446_006372 [Penicillium canescens]KAJ6065500.1 hypothetical protein N7444_001153 [Penicillium canescens]